MVKPNHKNQVQNHDQDQNQSQSHMGVFVCTQIVEWIEFRTVGGSSKHPAILL